VIDLTLNDSLWRRQCDADRRRRRAAAKRDVGKLIEMACRIRNRVRNERLKQTVPSVALNSSSSSSGGGGGGGGFSKRNRTP
jgi:hypothetical protein